MGAPLLSEDIIWLSLGVTLAVFLLLGSWRGFRRGPFRVAVTFFGTLAAYALAWLFGEEVGALFWEGTSVPWLIRGMLGGALVVVVSLVALHLWLWWRDRRAGGAAKVDRPGLGALFGAGLGLFWFSVLLALLLTVAAAVELLAAASGDARIRAAFSPVVQVRTVLAGDAWTRGLGEWDPLPAKLQRVVPKAFAVLRDKAAFQRLQSDESLRSLAAHPAFYPLAKDSRVAELVKRRDFHGLLSHPKVVVLLSDDDFQRRLSASDYEGMLDRALAEDVHTTR